MLDVGQGQCITAFAGDATVMIDCGNTYNLSDAGDLAAAYLHSWCLRICMRITPTVCRG